jgi:hypothetical protein
VSDFGLARAGEMNGWIESMIASAGRVFVMVAAIAPHHLIEKEAFLERGCLCKRSSDRPA